MGEGGIRNVPSQCLKGLRELCNEHGILLIIDEVQTGVGRTGRLFAHEWAHIKPDVMSIAKGIGGRFPLGALLASRRLGMTSAWRYDHDVAIQRHEAGRQLGLARHILFGRPGARAAMLAEMIPSSVDDGCRLDEAAEARIRERYDASDEALKACGPLVRAETMAVCVYGVWPEYHHPDYGVMALDVLWSHPLRRHFDALIAGLDCLVDQYGLQAGRRARAA